VSALIDSNPAYASIKLIRADWDKWGRSDAVSHLGIRRRSTLIMFNEGAEVDRVIAQTGKDQIEALFKAVT
jgi:hypothetical protein